MDTIKSEAQTVAELCAKLNQPTLNVARSGVAVFPSGSVVNLENELLDANPKRPRAVVELYEHQSFIDYLNRFKITAQTVAFGVATETGGSFKAILDYHDKQDAATPVAAHWGEHICKLNLAATPEWTRWIAKNNSPFNQEQFAEFIEDNAQDLVQPDAGALLDMVQFLEGKRNVTFKSGKNLRTGAIEFEYTETIAETTGRREEKAEFPGRMIVRLTPFVGQESVDITARLRFRISDSGKVAFHYVLDRPFKVIEAAFNAIAAQIETDTGVPVMLGTGSVTPPPQIR
jgi:uncharacterized protein YfdQ (DUF2303 family)